MHHTIAFEFDAPEDRAIAIYAGLDDQASTWAVDNLARSFTTQYSVLDKP